MSNPNLAVSYIVESARVVEDANGLKLIESYVVDGLSGNRLSLLESLTATGLPQYGEGLDGWTGMFVVGRQPRPFAKNSRTQAIVDVTYGPNIWQPAIPRVTYHGTTKDFLTNKNKDGTLIKVNFDPASKDESAFFGGTSGKPMPTQIGIARGSKSLGILTFEFAYYKDPTIYRMAQNKLNSKKWFDGDKYTWHCSEAIIEPVLSRGGWNITMEFLYDEMTHIEPVFYRLEPNHVIPLDADDWKVGSAPGETGDGWTNPDLVDTFDFNTLKLPVNSLSSTSPSFVAFQ